MNFRTVFTYYLLISVVNLLLYNYYCIICTLCMNYCVTYRLYETFYVCFYWLKQHTITEHYDTAGRHSFRTSTAGDDTNFRFKEKTD